VAVYTVPGAAEPRDTLGPAQPAPNPAAILLSRWRFIAVCTLVSMVATFAAAKFALTPYYRATALLRPSQPKQGLEDLNTWSRLFATQVPVVSLFAASAQSRNAQEFMAILHSYAFNIALINQYHLAAELIPPRRGWFGGATKPPTPWQLYRRAQALFDCEFDELDGNLTMHFLAPDRSTAVRILSLYVDNLRDNLRSREVRNAEAGVRSLREQISDTTDSLLRGQLYELVAQQLGRQKLAEVQADFAFAVIDPPVAADKPFWPRVTLDTALAGLLALFVSSVGVVLIVPGPHGAGLSSREGAHQRPLSKVRDS
jgi:hypothetical protein